MLASHGESLTLVYTHGHGISPRTGIGDLFDMLLPMLVIYQEYVRNHHFSLQVLAECKQKEVFSKMLKRLEEKPALQGRTLETFLTYPMHQVFSFLHFGMSPPCFPLHLTPLLVTHCLPLSLMTLPCASES